MNNLCNVCGSRYIHPKYSSEDKAYCGLKHRVQDNPKEYFGITVGSGILGLIFAIFLPNVYLDNLQLSVVFFILTGVFLIVTIWATLTGNGEQIASTSNELSEENVEFTGRNAMQIIIISLFVGLMLIIAGIGYYSAIFSNDSSGLFLGHTFVVLGLLISLLYIPIFRYRIYFENNFLIVQHTFKQDKINLDELTQIGNVSTSTKYTTTINWVELFMTGGRKVRYEGFNKLSVPDLQRLVEQIIIKKSNANQNIMTE